MEALNLNGTTGACRCGTWLNHWLNYSGRQLPKQCSVSGCTREDLVGGHVKIRRASTPTGGTHYIVPICKGCNKKADWMPLVATALAVPAAKANCA